MPEERAQRRLAAILAADVVGYGRLMEADEAGTLAALKLRRKNVLEPLIAHHHGRIVKLMGDRVLVEFGSVVNAVRCAVELQQGFAVANASLADNAAPLLRVGVNLGDVVVEGGDFFGEGVIVAVRLQALADPGGICISSGVHDQIEKKLALAYEDLGPCEMKNMAKPVHVFRIASDVPARNPAPAVGAFKPSIAVLPFTNMSGDPEQEYFSDGITDDIITDLSKVSTLHIVSRNTVFTFKGKSVDVGQIARQLKVGYVVEGSVRKAGGRIRITAQLIDASKDSHLWAERYDRELNDIFALQDEISQAIVAALKVTLLPEEKKAIESRSTQNPKAYQLYLMARHYQTQYTERSQQVALRFCQRALEIDPAYARAWALVSLCQASLYLRGQFEESGLSSAEKALSLDPTLAEAHATKGRALAELGRFDEALVANEESLRLEPDSFDVQANAGRTCMLLGRLEAAIAHYERAAQLVEADYACLSMAGSCYHLLGRQAERRSTAGRTIERIEREIKLRPDNAHAITMGAYELAYLGEKERAKDWASRALIIEPDDPLIHYNLAGVMAEMNETDQALDLLEAYADKMPPAHPLDQARPGPDNATRPSALSSPRCARRSETGGGSVRASSQSWLSFKSIARLLGIAGHRESAVRPMRYPASLLRLPKGEFPLMMMWTAPPPARECH
jgi:adenylate cyclase